MVRGWGLGVRGVGVRNHKLIIECNGLGFGLRV
jgi:hypothetical protein